MSVAVLFALSACNATLAPTPSPAASSSSRPSVGTSESPTSSQPVVTLASGEALPACTPGKPNKSDTVTFVASGYAWALSPSGTDLTCLFAVADAGPFEWGPLGDRVLLGGLEVKGVAGGPSLAPSGETVPTIEWSRPTGKSLVYAPAADTSLKKVHLDGTKTQNVTPIASPKYLQIAYHPSGEAFAFVVERDGNQSIWIASNAGKKPERLVFSNVGTRFTAIGFDVDGKHLLYAAQHADDHPELHTIDLTDTELAPLVWAGQAGKRILDIRPGRTTGTVAWTTGTSCADSIAMAQTPAATVRVRPDVTEPTRAIGWVGATRLLVATGGCGGPLDLSIVVVSTGLILPLVSGVSAAAVRTPVPTPAAPLPKAVAAVGSGFG